MASGGVSTVAVMVVMFLPSTLFATLPFRAGHLGHVGAVCVVVGAPPQVQRLTVLEYDPKKKTTIRHLLNILLS